MKLLLDTHAFLWWITNDSRLSARVYKALQSQKNEIFLSAVSGWEIAIKASLGRLDLPKNPAKFILEQIRLNAIQTLPVHITHALHVSTLPNLHKDPFDRMLIAQSQTERLPLATVDSQITQYKVKVYW